MVLNRALRRHTRCALDGPQMRHFSRRRAAGGRIVWIMDVVYPGFGTIVFEGERFEHDMVVEAGRTRPRKKGPSKVHRHRYGHTPLSVDEDVPC